jgi:ABC-type xylose transport system, periplasmic component
MGIVGALAVGATVLAGCGSSGGSGGSDHTSAPPVTSASAGSTGSTAAGAAGALTGKSFKIGLDLPETTTARYETKDRPYFTAALKQFCPNCKLLYGNANSSASTQQQQAESMLAQGANVLVIDPFDGVAAASIVSGAKTDKVPVVAYDRLIQSPDLAYVVSNDYKQVGKLQAATMIQAMKAKGVSSSSGGILMINGADTDNNAHSIHAGAMPIIQASGYKVLASHDTWDPTDAQQWVAGQITRFGHQIIGIYSANDTNASSAIAALKTAGWSNKQISALDLTGLDASVQGLQNILASLQLMTTYNAFKVEATMAAKAAVQMALGQKPESNGTVSGHPAFLNPPQAITVKNIESTVIKDGFWKPSDLCAGQYAADCQKAGIQ